MAKEEQPKRPVREEPKPPKERPHKDHEWRDKDKRTPLTEERPPEPGDWHGPRKYRDE